jgi:hypothetical protein
MTKHMEHNSLSTLGQGQLPAVARTLVEHPRWPLVAPAIKVEAGTLLASGHRHRRIEMEASGFSGAELAEIVLLRVACAACGRAIQPFRRRRGRSAGRAERPGRLFIALTCELADSIGCSRGLAATRAYEQLIFALRAVRRA